MVSSYVCTNSRYASQSSGSRIASENAIPRRTQDARTITARQKLLSATIELLKERGYGGLTTKEVSARAGFSNGALMHHFSTKADLVIAAGARICERHIESGRKNAASFLAKTDPLEAFISDCVDVYLGPSFIPTMEIMIAARTDPLMNAPFQAFINHYHKTMNKIWLSALTHAGYSKQEASFLIVSTLNLMRGIAINSLWQCDRAYYTSVLREWGKLVRKGSLKGARIEVRRCQDPR